MNNSYLMTVSREGSCLYGGRLDNYGRYSAFELERKKAGDASAWDALSAAGTGVGVGVMFSPAFAKKEKDTFLGLLSGQGTAGLREYDFDEWLCKGLKGHGFALVLTADGGDLFVRLYQSGETKLLHEARIDGAGNEPRVAVLAECIWKKLLDDAPYLNKQKDFADVLRIAAGFIASGKAELQGEIQLEGETREFFVKRRDADIGNSIDHGSATLLSALRDFRAAHKTDDGDTLMVLSAGLAGNKYFVDVLNGFLPDMVQVDDNLRKDVLNLIMDDLNQNGQPGGVFVADGLARKNIGIERGEDFVKFKIDIPEGFNEVDVLRGGKKIRTITRLLPELTDTGLQPAHEYSYSLVLVYTDDAGCRKETRGCDINVSTMAAQMPEAVRLSIADEADKAVLSWSKPNRGEVKIYVGDKPFGLHPNDRVEDTGALNAETISSLDTEHIVKKDFCGQRFYMPVTVGGGVAVAGNEVCVSSMVPPRGVRTDATVPGHVKVVWLWDGVPAVRVKWTDADGNEMWRDIERGASEPEFELPSLPKTGDVEVGVSSLFTCSDGETMTSSEVKCKAAVTTVKVNYTEAKSEAKLFTNKDKYSVTLQAESEPPCDLYVLVQEGNSIYNKNNFKSHFTIHHSELATGGARKFTISYQRNNKKVPLYFIIIPADGNAKVKIVPEVKSVK